MKRWYVVQVLTGTEALVKADLEAQIRELGFEEKFGRILIPENSQNPSSDSEQREKIFPGYLIIEMEMDGDSRRMVCDTQRVHRFLGGDSPAPLSNSEVEKIFEQISGKVKIKNETAAFNIGEEVHITSGPFEGFVGIIEELDEERERMKVMVSIFGRMTAIGLGFDQVKR